MVLPLIKRHYKGSTTVKGYANHTSLMVSNYLSSLYDADVLLKRRIAGGALL